jgi:hypothetical protein
MEKHSQKETEQSGNTAVQYEKKDPGVFYNLKLSKESLEDLFKYFKKHKKRDKFIFQFFYPKDPLDGSPTLGAYPMRSKNQRVENENKFAAPILDYHNKSSEPLTGRPQFLGDQQLDVDDLKQLIEDSNKPDPDAFEYLLFTARFQDENPHIFYDVTVQPSNQVATGSVSTDPSPPAPAK